jgi:hypothetical protein
MNKIGLKLFHWSDLSTLVISLLSSHTNIFEKTCIFDCGLT